MSNKTKQEIHRKSAEAIFSLAGLESLGFKFTKTKGIIRKESKFEESIGFSSSARSNSLEGVNLFIVTAGIDDLEFKKWQEEVLKKEHCSGLVGGGKIKNLFTPGPPYISFDLGDNVVQQQSVIDEITKIISDEVLAFFLICRSPEKIAENALLPGFYFPTIIEYFHFLNRSDLIHSALDKKIKSHEEFPYYLKHFHDKIMAEGVPPLGFKESFGDEMKVSAAKIAIKFHELGIKNWL